MLLPISQGNSIENDNPWLRTADWTAHIVPETLERSILEPYRTENLQADKGPSCGETLISLLNDFYPRRERGFGCGIGEGVVVEKVMREKQKIIVVE